MVGIVFFLKKPSFVGKNILVLFANLFSLAVVKMFSLTAFNFSLNALTPLLLFVLALFGLKKEGGRDGEGSAEKIIKLNVLSMFGLIVFFAAIMIFEKNLVLPPA